MHCGRHHLNTVRDTNTQRTASPEAQDGDMMDSFAVSPEGVAVMGLQGLCLSQNAELAAPIPGELQGLHLCVQKYADCSSMN